MKQIFETERILLRPWGESDAEALYECAKDPLVGPAAGWKPHTSVENSREIIGKVLAVPETYAIVLKEAGQPIGSIGLHFHSDLAKEGEPELGYWVARPYWGRGIAPEAATLLLDHAFFDMGFEKVWCGYYDGNEKSKRVQEKLGFVHQWTSDDVPVPQLGEVRRGHVGLLTKEDWEKKRKSRKVAIRLMKEEDRDAVLSMMKTFYESPAVSTNGSYEIFNADFDASVGKETNLAGYMILVDGSIAGYGMVAKSFSTEFGRPALWIEDIYLKEGYRGQGIGKAFFAFLEKEYKGYLFRLELERENEAAHRLYKSRGFDELSYLEMKKYNDRKR